MKNLKCIFFCLIIFASYVSVAGQTNSSDTTASNYLEIGAEYLRKGDFDSSEIWLLKSIDLLEKSDEKEKLAEAYKAISGSFHFRGNFVESIKHLQSAQNIYEELEMHEDAAGLMVNISMSYFSQLRFHESLEKAMEAIEVGEKYKSDKVLGRAYLMAGQGHEGLKEYDKALEFYQKGKPIIEEGGNPVLKATLYNVIGNTFFYSGKYEESLQQLDKSYQIYQSINNQRGFQEVNKTRGRVLIAIGKYAEALPILEQNLSLFKVTNDLKSTATINEYLSLCYEGLGNYKKALYAEREYVVLNDSILGEKRIEEVAELEARYEVQKKENEILELENENILAELKSARLSRIIIGALIVMVFIALLAFLFFRNAKKMERLNRQLAEQKNEIEQKNHLNETLVKEIHHRVKNNLQVLSSLLSLQSDFIQDKNTLEAVSESRNRVQSMGLIHQKLYMGENIAAVDMNEYLSELSAHLLDSFGIADSRIKINTEVDAPKLDVDTAIPLGLIINELITNSMKYAFPEGKNGTIEIELKIDAAGKLRLKVSDNGVGKESVLEDNNSTLFGSNMVEILSKKLKGEINKSFENGFETVIHFKRYQIA